MAEAMEFGFLLDPERQLLSIGYRAADGTLDPSCYDLLASEARLASFIAIAKGDVPARHWFRLGRAVTPVGHGAALISWSGSMFEYLMPSLVMRAPSGQPAGADQPADRAAADRIRRDARHALGHFGIRLQRPRPGAHLPVLELRRARPRPQARPGRERRDRALRDGARRHGRSAARGAQFRAARRRSARAAATASTRRSTTRRSRLPEGSRGRHRARLHGASSGHDHGRHRQRAPGRHDARALPRRAERPGDRAAAAGAHAARRRRWRIRAPRRSKHGGADHAMCDLPERAGCTPRTSATPQTHLLSNGRYAVMLTAAGSGYSRWRDLAVTRWREDATCDDWGSYIFLRDVDSGARLVGGLSAERRRARQLRGRPSPRIARSSSAPTRDLTTTLEVVVSPEDDAEVRRVSITNAGDRAARDRGHLLCELVLAPPAADAAHPAFSKLFVQTEYVAEGRRDPGDAPAALGTRAGNLGGASRRRRRRGHGRSRRSRPTGRAFSAAAATFARADRRDGRPASVQHRRHGARSGLRAAPSRADRRRARPCASPSGPVVAASRDGRARSRRQAPRRQRLRARGHAGLDAGAGAAAPSRHRRRRGRPVSAPRRPPALCRRVAAAVLRHHPPRRGRRRRRCGPRASPAICRSCCCGSTMSKTSTSPASCCRRTNTGG